MRQKHTYNKIQFSAVQLLSRVWLCNPMNHSTSGLPVHHLHPEFTQTHVHWVGDAIQPSHPLSSLFPPAPNPSQHQSLFQWVNSSHEVAKVLTYWLTDENFIMRGLCKPSLIFLQEAMVQYSLIQCLSQLHRIKLQRIMTENCSSSGKYDNLKFVYLIK